MNRDRNNWVHNIPGTTKVGVSIRGVQTNKHTKGRINSLCKLDWDPMNHKHIPPHKMWARILEVEPSRLTAKFMHRPGRLNIILDVAEDKQRTNNT
jgi:hypothetical protein